MARSFIWHGGSAAAASTYLSSTSTSQTKVSSTELQSKFSRRRPRRRRQQQLVRTRMRDVLATNRARRFRHTSFKGVVVQCDILSLVA